MAPLFVMEPGTLVSKDGNRIVLTQGKDHVMEVPIVELDQVFVMGQAVQVTTAVVHFLARRNVPLVYTNRTGTQTIQQGLGNDVERRVRQVHLASDPARALPLVRAIVQGKLYNQAAVLRAWAGGWPSAGPHSVSIVERLYPAAGQAPTADGARGQEGSGAAAYWRAWQAAFERDWGFRGRAYHPPPDPVNALLSFGYTLLFHQLLLDAQVASLDPFVGFFHTLAFGRPSLALDLEEEFRPLIVDQLVLELLAAGTFKRSDFTSGGAEVPEGGVYLGDAGRKQFLRAYAEYLQRLVLYPHSDGIRRRETWRNCLTLQVAHFTRVVDGREAAYRPLLWPDRGPGGTSNGAGR